MSRIQETKPKRRQEQKKKVMHPWEPSEDSLLLAAIEKYGESNWAEIAECIPNRNRKQCKERYINNLMHKNNKRPWTVEEDEIILSKRLEFGNKWSKIAPFLVERSPNNVKNRFFGHLKKFVDGEESKEEHSSHVSFSSVLDHQNLSVFTPVDRSVYVVDFFC